MPEKPAQERRFRGSVALVAEYPPPAAGMTVQAELLRRSLEDEGTRVVPVRTNASLPEGLARLRYVRGLIRWIRFLWSCRRLRDVDVVHVFACSGLSFWLFAVPPVALGRLLRRGVVVHYHGGAVERFATANPRVVGWTLATADRLVVPSKFLEQVFLRLGHEAEVIGNPTDLAAFGFAAKREGDPVVVSCRNLEPVYDIGTTLRAFAVLLDARPEARLLLAGEGSERDSLEALAAALGIEPAVEFLGNVPNQRMPELLARAHVLVNSSRNDNLPGSILEAFAAGVPVVSTDAGGIPWLIEHGINGLLAPVGDWRGLAESLARVLGDPGLARRLARQGRESAGALSWESIGPRWSAVYAALPHTRVA